jgi:3-hydroxymyristoyl/3-hydroxydecanoyl-(acyl carrier protein) dehydratase
MIRVSDEVSAEHAAFAGHFPGNPMVPGVLLLARVARAATAAFGASVGGVPAVKFLAPLRPGERFEVELEPPAHAAVRFRVVRDGALIASGTLRLAG